MLKNILKNKLLSKSLLVLSLILTAGVAILIQRTLAVGPLVVTPANGGTGISMDTTSAPGGTGTWTTLGVVGGPVITESVVGQISTGVHTLTLPAGWEFKTDENVTVGVNGGTNLVVSNQVVTPGTNSLSFNITTASSDAFAPAILTFSGIRVRPTGTVVGTGNMTHSGSAMSDVDGSTNFGTFTTVAGAVNKMVFSTQPTDTAYGSTISNVVVKTQDQFGNDSVASLGSNSNVVISLLSGSGVLAGTLTRDIGVSSGNGTVTFDDLTINDIGAKTLQASNAGLTVTTVDSNSFNINQKVLTATITVNNKTYDGDNPATITGRNLVGVVGTDDVHADGGAATFADKNVGVGKVVSASGMTLDGADSGKYSFDGTGAGTADISALAITVTADPGQNKTYGDSDPVFTYAVVPALIGGDSFTGALLRATGENIGAYAMTQGTLSAGTNYSITFVPDNLTINTRAITVTASTNTKVYDRTTVAAAVPTITVGSLKSGDTANFIETYDNFNVGTGKTLTPSGTVADGNSGNNYAYTFVDDTTGVITAKGLDTTGLSAPSKVYDQNNTATVNGVAALSGVIAPDAVTIGGVASGLHNTVNVGATTVTVSGLSLGGADNANYSLNIITLSSSISAYPVTVTVTAGKTKVFGDVDPALTYTHTGLLGADAFSGALTRDTGEDVGNYNINQGTLTAGDNYSISFVGNQMAITAKPIVITPDDGQAKTYGGVDPSFSYVPAPALLGSDTFSGALSRDAGENAGTYSYSIGTLSAGTNYSLSLTPGKIFTINKANPVITWTNPADIVYGTALSGTQLNASADVAGAFTYNPLSGVILNAGNAQVLSVAFVPTDITNYNSIPVTTVLINVLKATPVITWANPTAIVAGTALDGVQLNASSGGVPGVFTYTPASGYVYTTVGTYTLSTDFVPTDTANYNSVNDTEVSLSVVPAAINYLDISASPSSLNVALSSTITVNGYDAYGNLVTNDSATRVYVHSDGSATLSSASKLLTAGVATFTLNSLIAGTSLVDTWAMGSVTPDEVPVTFIGDITAPTITMNVAPVQSITQTSANIVFQSSENGTAKVHYGLTTSYGNVTDYQSVMANTDKTIALTGLTCGTTYNYVVYAKDDSNNERIGSNASFATSPCTTAVIPTISLVGAATLPQYTVAAADTRFSSDLKVDLTNATSISVNGVVSNAPATPFTVATNAVVKTVGVHSYDLIVTSSTGHTVSLNISFEVVADTDIIAPTITPNGTPVQNITQTSANIVFQSSENGTAKVNFGNTVLYGQVTVNEAVVSATTKYIGIAGLTCGTTYYYRITATDNAGNSSINEASFSTVACTPSDTTAPVITHSNESQLSKTQTTVGVTFSSSETGSAKIHYGLSNAYGNVTDYQAVVATTNKTITLTGLTCGTTYHYNIYAMDGSNNEANKGDLTFLTSACSVGDIIAPSVNTLTPADNSTGVAVSITPNIVFNEAMDASTINASTVQLRKYSDDSLINSIVTLNSAGTTAVISPVANLSNSIQYYVWVSGAKDVAGNVINDYTTKANQEFTTVAPGVGVFGILNTTMTKMTGSADNTYANGWEWIIRMTLPSNKNKFSLKFNDWTSGANVLGAGGNMEYYSEQVASGAGSAASPKAITASNTYPTGVDVFTDLDPTTDGIQTDVHVKVKLPTSTVSGSYTTSYMVNYVASEL